MKRMILKITSYCICHMYIFKLQLYMQIKGPQFIALAFIHLVQAMFYVVDIIYKLSLDNMVLHYILKI